MTLRISYAAACGGLGGALIGISVCILKDMSWVDAVFRVFVLSASAAWMGMLLAWLNLMLSPVDDVQQDEDHSQ